MIRHPINYSYPGEVLGHTLRVNGEVRVEYPKANIDVTVLLEGFFTTEKRYSFEIGPGKLSDEQTRTFVIEPITVKLSAKGEHALVYITVTSKKFGQLYAHTVSYREHEGPHKITAYGLYAVIEALEGIADHTYVEGQDIHSGYKYAWPCGGAFEDGRGLTSGEADGNVLDCISLRKTDIKLAGGLAGIRYAIDGVCHQGANRIMFPAGLIVDQACGWLLSSYMYGCYGVHALDGQGLSKFIEILDHCCPDWRDNLSHRLNPSLSLADLYAAETASLRQQWAALTDGQITNTQEDDLLDEKEKVRILRDELAQNYGMGSVAGKDAANRINSMTHQCLDQAARIVGPALYELILGMKPGFRTLLVDPEIAFLAFISSE